MLYNNNDVYLILHFLQKKTVQQNLILWHDIMHIMDGSKWKKNSCVYIYTKNIFNHVFQPHCEQILKKFLTRYIYFPCFVFFITFSTTTTKHTAFLIVSNLLATLHYIRDQTTTTCKG